MNTANKPDAAKGDPTRANAAPKPEAKGTARRVLSSRALPSSTELKGRWKRRIGAAKIAWGKLTEDELLQIEGHEQKLSGLIQQRYAITRDEALRQVKAFFSKHRS
jgi:uncharacterized protein YjbJ (UPF0337 family)